MLPINPATKTPNIFNFRKATCWLWITLIALLSSITPSIAQEQLSEEHPTITVATHDVDRMSFNRQDGYRDGRDIRVARYVLNRLGYEEDSIEFVPVEVDKKFTTVIDKNAR